ncbi:MAG: hypothetical protein GEU82_09190 [Luteitalea sp.]|nr:hypothetical protein [Luteitalea sp.]
MSRRVRAFIAVGAAGFVLQIAVAAMLTWIFGWSPAGATALGVEVAILHNFFAHQRWTWRDRRPAGGDRFRRLLHFHLTSGAASIAGNVFVVRLAVHVLSLDVVLANGLAVGAMSLANYLLADRLVFTRLRTAAVVIAVGLAARGDSVAAFGAEGRVTPESHNRLSTPASAAVDLTPHTLAAWTDYVARAERSLATAALPPAPAEPTGHETRIPGGIVHEWRGSVTVPGITVPQLVDALTNPGTPPPQDDVVESRVLARDGDQLRVYLKLVRTAMITVTYDTEHDVTFVRHSSRFATSRSVATRITEVGGEDHGFLWKLNSYWRYRQTDAGVQVEVVSLSLSRGVPLVVRPLVGPIVNRIARQSMTRTLDAVRLFGEGLRVRPVRY